MLSLIIARCYFFWHFEFFCSVFKYQKGESKKGRSLNFKIKLISEFVKSTNHFPPTHFEFCVSSSPASPWLLASWWLTRTLSLSPQSERQQPYESVEQINTQTIQTLLTQNAFNASCERE